MSIEMASAPLLLLLVATAAPPIQPAVASDQSRADVLSALIDAGDELSLALDDDVADAPAPKKKQVVTTRFVVVVENPPAPSSIAHVPALEPARPGSPRGPPR